MFRVSYPRAQWSEGRKGALSPFLFSFPFHPPHPVTTASRVLATMIMISITGDERGRGGCERVVRFIRNLVTRVILITMRKDKRFKID